MARLGDASTAAPTCVTPSETMQEVTLAVSVANTVSLGGRVVDEYGKPIAGALVRVDSRWMTSKGAEVIETSSLLSKVVTDAVGCYRFPRTLLRRAQHQASARATGKFPNTTEWFAATTPSFFDLPLYPTPPPDQAQIQADFDAGWAAQRKGDYAEAQTRFESVLKRAAEQKITDPLQLSWWHGGLASTLLNLGKLVDAEREVRIVLALRAKALPADHPSLVDDLRGLADICVRLDKDEEAAALYRRALTIHDRGPGRDAPWFGRLLCEFGYLALKRDRVAEAEPVLERARRVLENALGPANPELFSVLINLGHALTKLERFDNAERVLRRALALAEQTDGPGQPRTNDALSRLAYVLRRKSLDAEAAALEARPRTLPVLPPAEAIP